MLRIISMLILTTFICTANIGTASVKEPLSESAKTIGVAVVQDLLSRKTYMQYISDHYNGLHYAEAAVGYGALKFSAEINDQELVAALDARYAQVPGVEKLLAAEHVDANVWGALPIQQY